MLLQDPGSTQLEGGNTAVLKLVDIILILVLVLAALLQGLKEGSCCWENG